jgi:hypothetical protein
MIQQGLRQAGGLVAVYYAVAVFGLGYPYWAAMAARDQVTRTSPCNTTITAIAAQ